MSSRSKSGSSSLRVEAELRMQRSRSNRPRRPLRDTTYDEEADAALRTALATEELGSRTLIKLKEQTEQIHSIEDTIKAADNNLISTERSIRSMGSFTGRLRNFFIRSEAKTDIEVRRKEEQKIVAKHAKADEKQKAKESERVRLSSSKKERSQRGAGVLDNDDERLNAISESVRTLHLMAQDINGELTAQNRMMNGIGDDVHSLQTRIEKQSRQIQKLQ